MRTDDIRTADEFLQRVRDEGGQASDGPLADFTEGWAVLPFHGDKAHWWKVIDRDAMRSGGWPDVRDARRRCDPDRPVLVNPRAGFLGRGNVDACQRCAVALTRKPR